MGNTDTTIILVGIIIAYSIAFIVPTILDRIDDASLSIPLKQKVNRKYRIITKRYPHDKEIYIPEYKDKFKWNRLTDSNNKEQSFQIKDECIKFCKEDKNSILSAYKNELKKRKKIAYEEYKRTCIKETSEELPF